MLHGLRIPRNTSTTWTDVSTDAMREVGPIQIAIMAVGNLREIRHTPAQRLKELRLYLALMRTACLQKIFSLAHDKDDLPSDIKS